MITHTHKSLDEALSHIEKTRMSLILYREQIFVRSQLIMTYIHETLSLPREQREKHFNWLEKYTSDIMKTYYRRQGLDETR